MNKYIAKLIKIVDQQYYMLPIGFLFGLSFDTATQVALLAISVTVGSLVLNIPFYTLFIFPFLFAAGMVLTNSTDGFFMNFAYGWAFRGTLKKLWYNITYDSSVCFSGVNSCKYRNYRFGRIPTELGWTFLGCHKCSKWSILGLRRRGNYNYVCFNVCVSYVVYKAQIKTKIDAIPC